MSDELRGRVIKALRTVHDPEIPVNIYDLGLIYEVEIGADADVAITMTLTAPNCPVADKIPADAEAAVRTVEGVRTVKATLTFDPPWTPERMTDVARLEMLAMGVDPDRAKDHFTSGATGLTIGRRPANRPR